jgi:hypothetical protein
LKAVTVKIRDTLFAALSERNPERGRGAKKYNEDCDAKPFCYDYFRHWTPFRCLYSFVLPFQSQAVSLFTPNFRR